MTWIIALKTHLKRSINASVKGEGGGLVQKFGHKEKSASDDTRRI